jgi:hypothetical protein
MTRTYARGGLFVGLLLILLSTGCASTLNKEDLTVSGKMPVFTVVDPATEDFPEDLAKIQLRDWNYTSYPQQIVTESDWKLFFIACFQNQSPKITRSWHDMAYFLGQREARSPLQRLYVYAYQQKFPYFLSKGDDLSTEFVKLAVFSENSAGGLVRLNRSQYRTAHYPNTWTKLYKGIGFGESDPTLEAFQNLPMQWLPRAPRQRRRPASRARPKRNSLAKR